MIIKNSKLDFGTNFIYKEILDYFKVKSKFKVPLKYKNKIVSLKLSKNDELLINYHKDLKIEE